MRIRALALAFLPALFFSSDAGAVPHARPTGDDTLATRRLLREAFDLADALPESVAVGTDRRVEIVLAQWSIGDSTLVGAELKRMRRRLSWAGVAGARRTESYIEIARGLRRRGATPEACAMARDIAMLAPNPRLENDPRAWHEIATWLYAMGDSRRALELASHGQGDSLLEREWLPLIGERLASSPDWPLAWEMVSHLEPSETKSVLLHCLAYTCARSDDWVTAEQAANAMPEEYGHRAIIFVAVAEAAWNAGQRAASGRILETALGAFEASPTDDRNWGDLGRIAGALIRNGHVERGLALAARGQPSDQRIARFELARMQALAGTEARALATLDSACSLRPFNAVDQGWPDEGLVDWITEMADSARDSTALKAVELLNYGVSRGYAMGQIAVSQAWHGRLDAARATLERIEQSPEGAAEALVALAQAEARAGDLPAALAVRERIAVETERRCRGPMEFAPSMCPHPYPCPPLDLIATSRTHALVAIAGTPAGRIHLPRWLEATTPAEQIELRLAAARSYLETN